MTLANTLRRRLYEAFIADGSVKTVNTENVNEVALGNVVGSSSVNKFGENPDIDTGTVPEDIWDFGGTYTFSTTTDIDSISSSETGDTIEIIIQGLDVNWELVTQAVTLDGQTRVALTTPLIRCFRAYNPNGTLLVGTVYIYVNGTLAGGVPTDSTTVRAIITPEHQQTMMCIYTIPSGKSGLLLGSYVSLSNTRATAAKLVMRGRTFNGVFRTMASVALATVGNSSFIRKPAVPSFIPEKTDIVMRCTEVTANGTSIAGGFDLILKDN